MSAESMAEFYDAAEQIESSSDYSEEVSVITVIIIIIVIFKR